MNERIRVLRVIARLNVGGPALHVSYLAHGLASRGYETTLVTGSLAEGEGSMEYVLRQQDVEPIVIPELQREISPFADVASVVKLRNLIREFRPDILHTHTAKAGALGRIAAGLAGTRVRRSSSTPSTAMFSAATSARPSRADSGVVERELAPKTDALIAVSPEVRDDLVRLGVAPAGG